MPSLEGKAVQDAERLDTIGVIGIARAFAYGRHKRRELYNPEVRPQQHETVEQCKANTGPAINHFYKGLMNTQTAKVMATEHHQYMDEYLHGFSKNGEEKISIPAALYAAGLIQVC